MCSSHWILASFCGECVIKMKQFKILSLKSSHLSKFHQNPLTLHMMRNITAAQKHAQDFSESDVLAQTNQISYDGFFFCMVQKTEEKYFLKI